MSYSNPIPGGSIGRTDQGVDISAPPGTPVYAITNETLAGVIPNWYTDPATGKSQPFYWFKQAGSNIYNYVAEQFRSKLQVGQSVQQGQEIGTVASSGTGLELGFATPSGQTLARATTGYTEGQATPAGQSYRSQVLNGNNNNNGLAKLWIDAGGPPNVANIMAAIAMAESSGNPQNVGGPNQDGTYDYGLWQINSSHTQFNRTQLLDSPLYNARAAVSVYKSQGLGAWSTYNSGAYLQYMNSATTGPTYGGTRPGGQPAGTSSASSAVSGGSSGQVQNVLGSYTSLRDMPRTAPPGTKNPFQWWLASFTGNWDKLGGGVS